MSLKTYIFVFLLLGLQFNSCDKNKPFEPTIGEFAIYKVLDTGIILREKPTKSIDSLTLTKEPVISIEDMKSYVWSTDIFPRLAIKSNCMNKIDTLMDLHDPFLCYPFLVCVGNDRIYFGAFRSIFSSYHPTYPCFHRKGNDTIVITYIDPDENRKKIYDNRIYESLKEYGLLVD